MSSTPNLTDPGPPPTPPAPPAPDVSDLYGNTGKLVAAPPTRRSAPPAATIAPATPALPANDASQPDTRSLPEQMLDLVNSIDDVIHKTEYTQKGREQHPVLAKVGDTLRNAKEYLVGGQEAGKPLGTSSGVLNNPITQAISLAPEAATAATKAEELLKAHVGTGLEDLNTGRTFTRDLPTVQRAASEIPAPKQLAAPSPVIDMQGKDVTPTKGGEVSDTVESRKEEPKGSMAEYGGIERRGPYSFGRAPGKFGDAVNQAFQTARDTEASPKGEVSATAEKPAGGEISDKVESRKLTVPKKNQGPDAAVLENGGWLLPDGQNFVHVGRETHGESALAAGFDETDPEWGSRPTPMAARVNALKLGAVRVSPGDAKDGETLLQIGDFTNKSKPRLLDALNVAPIDRPVTIEYGAGWDSKEFDSPEEAIDWVDRRSISNTIESRKQDIHPALEALNKPELGYHTAEAGGMMRVSPSFIRPDGQVTYLGKDWHPDAIKKAAPEYGGTEEERTRFINDTNAIRVRPNMSQREGETFHVTVPEKGVTHEQVQALKDMQKSVRYGNLMVETASKPSQLRTNMEHPKDWQYKSANDVEPILAKLGVHPDQKVLLNDLYGDKGRFIPNSVEQRAGVDFPGNFEKDNFASRRTTGNNMNDPESLITGEEMAKGMTPTNSHRDFPNEEAYQDVVHSKNGLSPADIAKKYPRVFNEEPRIDPKIAAHYRKNVDDITTGPEHLEIPRNLRSGATTQETIWHEVGHNVVGDLLGLPVEGNEVWSHLHPDAGTGAAATTKFHLERIPGVVRTSPNSVRFSPQALAENLPQLVKMYVAGGVTEDLMGGLKFTKNPGVYSDMMAARKVLRIGGLPAGLRDSYIARSIEETRTLLNHPETLATIKEMTAEREEGLSKTLHVSAKKLEQINQKIREVRKNVNPTDAPAFGTRSTGEGNAAGVRTESGGVIQQTEPRGAEGVSGTGAEGTETKPTKPVQGTLFSQTADTWNKIADLHKENGGSTYNLATNKDLDGTDNYSVSTHPDRTKEIKGELTPQAIQAFAAKNADLLADKTESLGTWLRPADKVHVLDVVKTIPDRAEAVKLGFQHKQDAIYDLKNGKDIFMKDETGEKLTPQQQVINDIKSVDQSKASTLLAERNGKVRIKDLSSIETGKGNASKLLTAITDSADKHGVNLELTASPYGDEATRLNHDQLKAFYQRHGFVNEPGYDPSLGYMVRAPKSAISDKLESRRAPTEDIGAAVSKFTKSQKSYDILDKTEGKGGTWTSGGCWILADAVQKQFGGDLVAITTPDGRVQHIGTQIGDKIIDADGATSPEKWRSFWEKTEGVKGAKIASLDPKKVPSDIPPPEKSDEISTGLADQMSKIKPPKGSTVPLMSKPLTIEGTGVNGRVTLFDLAGALQKYAANGMKPDKEIEIALKRARSEMQYQLAQDNSGLGWYKKDTSDAVDHLTENGFPELKGPTKSALFRFIWGNTSYGVDPDVNLASAAEAWKGFQKTGKIPMKAESGLNWPGYTGIVSSLKSTQQLVDDFGEKGAVDWLMSKHPVSEIREQKKKTQKLGQVPGKADDLKYGAMIYGPKGGPFSLSLNGITDHTTVDSWGARAIRRWTGKLSPENVALPPTNEEQRQFHTVVSTLAKENNIDNGDAQAVLWGYEHDLYEKHGAGEAAKTYKGAAERYVKRAKEGKVGDFLTDAGNTFAEGIGKKVEENESGGPGPTPEGRTEDRPGLDKVTARAAMTRGISGLGKSKK